MSAALSERQHRILWLRAQGLSGPQVARVEHIAVSTVDWHERVIRHVLEARNITHAVHLATAADMLGPRIDCGDRAAYLRHIRRKEPTDRACRAAHAQHAVLQRAGLLRPQAA